MKLTVIRSFPFALTASDGSNRKLLQLQDSPEGGRPSLSDCQQQQRKGEARCHIAAVTLRACWHRFNHLFWSSCQSYIFLPFFVSLDCHSLLQSADQRHLLPEWRMCQPASQWPCQLWGELVPVFSPCLIQPSFETFHSVLLCFIVFFFLEICGVGTAGWGVHDVETGGVSFWGGSGHPTLPPHCSHIQRGRWEPALTFKTFLRIQVFVFDT